MIVREIVRNSGIEIIRERTGSGFLGGECKCSSPPKPPRRSKKNSCVTFLKFFFSYRGRMYGSYSQVLVD